MSRLKTKKDRTQRAHRRIRKRIRGTAEQPRLAVFKSAKHIYAQLIDDEAAQTLVASSSVAKELQADNLPHGGNISGAALVGELLAKKALQKNIRKVIFDRGGFLYHGRIKALAEAARQGGLEF